MRATRLDQGAGAGEGENGCLVDVLNANGDGFVVGDGRALACVGISRDQVDGVRRLGFVIDHYAGTEVQGVALDFEQGSIAACANAQDVVVARLVDVDHSKVSYFVASGSVDVFCDARSA